MSHLNDLEKAKELLDSGAITEEEFNEQKKQLLKQDKKPKKKGCLIAIGIFVVIVIIAAAVSSGNGNDSSDENNKTAESVQTEKETKKDTTPEQFRGDCPVTVSSTVSKNIINLSEVEINVINTTDKDIAAVQFYFIPRDVYGDVIDNWTTSNKLSSDDTITAGGSANVHYQLLDDNVKSGTLYVYSVYFTDGTEWGDRNASKNTIKQYGLSAEVSFS